METEAEADMAETQRITPSAGEAKATESDYNAGLPLDRAATAGFLSNSQIDRQAGRP